MEKLSVKKTRKLDLCVSCEICSAVCHENAITTEYKLGQFLPKVDDEKCIKCGLCLELCPGIEIDPLNLKYKRLSDDIFDGNWLECYTTFSNDIRIRQNSTSGGLITNLIIELIKNKEFDAAFVLDFSNFDGKPVRLKATSKITEVFKAAKSKYLTASVYNVIKTLQKREKKRYIIVGTPCQIRGIKKFIRQFKIFEGNLLFLGLFCEKTLNFNLIRYFEEKYRNSTEKLIKFEYKTKEKHGWPGDPKLIFDSGRELIVDRRARIQLKPYFQLHRCLFCYEKLNTLADISFGDCYIAEKSDFLGKSSVIVRTMIGKTVFEKYSFLLTKEKERIEKIRDSQRLPDLKNNVEYAKVFIKKHNIYPETNSKYEINNHAEKTLSKLQKHIRWGMNYNTSKIKLSLFLSKIQVKRRFVPNITLLVRMIFFVISIGTSLLCGWYNKRKKSILKRIGNGSLIIVGGELFNKGAQAMTFTVVDQVKRKFPDKDVYLFSTRDFERKGEEKDNYVFNILPWDDLNDKMVNLLGFWNRLFVKNGKYKSLSNDILNIIKNADFFVDISGYALSSQWESLKSVNYIVNIMIAKKHAIPFYIFPQSIGPFNYPIKHKILLFPLFKLYLKYPLKIFPREMAGLKHLHRFTKRNVEQKKDLVLQNEGYKLSNIYKTRVRFRNTIIKPNAVGIIPNMKIYERTNPDILFSVYKSLIEQLIEARKKVYILRHSFEDVEVCKTIKSLFPENKDVILIIDELNFIELENIIKQFDFTITSRYHSIINSYRNGVPVLVIGWAIKYYELLKSFNQLDYYFDVKDIDKTTHKIDRLLKNYKQEREKIIDRMNTLNKDNIFNYTFNKIEGNK